MENTCSVTTKSRYVRKFMATINYRGSAVGTNSLGKFKARRAVSFAKKKYIYIRTKVQAQHNHAPLPLRTRVVFGCTLFPRKRGGKTSRSELPRALYSLLTIFAVCSNAPLINFANKVRSLSEGAVNFPISPSLKSPSA